MAATVMANLKQDIISESRGMVVLFPEPYNPKAVAVAAKHNMIIPNNSAKQLLNEDFGNDTLVLAMNSHMKQKIYDEYSEAINVYTLSEYAGEPEQDAGERRGHQNRIDTIHHATVPLEQMTHILKTEITLDHGRAQITERAYDTYQNPHNDGNPPTRGPYLRSIGAEHHRESADHGKHH